MLRGIEVTLNGRITEEERKKYPWKVKIHKKFITSPQILKIILILIFLEIFYEKVLIFF